MNKGIWQSDWFAGIVITLTFMLFSGSDLISNIERSAYDFGVRASNKKPSNKVSIIAIDDNSIANLGRWPWPRDTHAQLLNLLDKADTAVIGQTIFFTEPQLDPGLQSINDLLSFYNTSHLVSAAEVFTQLNSQLANNVQNDLNNLKSKLITAENQLNTDRILATAIQKNGKVVLSMPFLFGPHLGKQGKPLPDYVTKNNLTKSVGMSDAIENGFVLPTTNDAIPPITELGSHALAIGNLTSSPDSDGGIRHEALVVDHYGVYYPSLALVLAAKGLNLELSDILVRLGEGVKVGNLNIRTNQALQMHTYFYNDKENGQSAFQIDSFYDVISGKIPLEKYKDKIVLIGATAFGVGNSQVTPIKPSMTPVETLAHSVSSILKQDFFIVPEWSLFAQIGLIVFIAIYLIIILPRIKAAMAFTITSTLTIAILLTHYVLMTQENWWIELMLPVMLLISGHLLLTTKHFLLTERGKLKSDFESAESNRMLGLSFQGQGQLDMAFEKFRKIPLDKATMELLYNLALDYERKRQFNKASSVYSYIAETDSKFKDISQRLARTKAMEETVILGGTGGSSAGGSLLLDGAGIQKPMLGRYEVEKELGKGAMGSVYLGKDPKISRIVAIKTMALSQEFEEDELQDVKNRFFREAETAGRLSHPNIVTIYDAGEEHDLAYIAMEYIKGTDLSDFTKSDSLLPLIKVISIIARAADALDYAHQQNVVHRDIKPANVMYERESDSLKITDFGIARITDSSKTKTGMVLGTPSYMSPEQLAGKRVDGRSDLFSLGVMLFQLATGELPFQADSMATLMYKIANEPHPDPGTIRKGLPRCITIIINRAMAKNIDKRYQKASQMASDLRKCAQITMKAAQKQ
ncbi:MAG: serine/threonine-protein kinase [Gammaproteobacteria bacterium]|nr:serine/threonine-protein kinase [Gammaproteobacteria bacterium]